MTKKPSLILSAPYIGNVAQWKRRLAEDSIEFSRRSFEVSGEPMLAWGAFFWARAEGLPIPGWVLAYLDKCTDRLLKMGFDDDGDAQNSAAGARKRNRRKNELAPRLAAAFGFKAVGKSGGARNPFTAVDGIEGKIRVAWLVEKHLRECGKEKEAKLSTVEYLTSRGHKISYSTVGRYWKDWRELAALNRPE